VKTKNKELRNELFDLLNYCTSQAIDCIEIELNKYNEKKIVLSQEEKTLIAKSAINHMKELIKETLIICERSKTNPPHPPK